MPYLSRIVYDVAASLSQRIWDGIEFLGRPVFVRGDADGNAALLHSADGGATWTQTKIAALAALSPTSPGNVLARFARIHSLSPDELVIAGNDATVANRATAAHTRNLTTFTTYIIKDYAGTFDADIGLAEYPNGINNEPTDIIEAFAMNSNAALGAPDAFVALYDPIFGFSGWVTDEPTALPAAAVTAWAVNGVLGPYADLSGRLMRWTSTAWQDVFNPMPDGTINYLIWWEKEQRFLAYQRTPALMKAIQVFPDTYQNIWSGQFAGHVADFVIVPGGALLFTTLNDNGTNGDTIRIYRATSVSTPPQLLATIAQANTLVYSPRLAVIGPFIYVSSFLFPGNRIRIHKLVPVGGGLRRRR
jgi:hypothetical protein